MNRYEVFYWNTGRDSQNAPWARRSVVGTYDARNGLDAIRVGLFAHGVTADEFASARTFGSNKRLVLAGITFEAKKVA